MICTTFDLQCIVYSTLAKEIEELYDMYNFLICNVSVYQFSHIPHTYISYNTITKVPMDKYVVTEITPYLVIDAKHVQNPLPLDDEEDIEIIRGVTSDEIIQMIREGDFNLVGGWGALLALQKLRELGEIQ